MSFDELFEEDDELSQELYMAVLKESRKAGYKPTRLCLYTWVNAVITQVSNERGIKMKDLQNMYGSYFDEIKDKSVAAIIKDIDREGH